ncbi:MAG TPA: VCBS repeat-containing protein [Thermoanaerobaculia bacterium]|nr:VCBS repeat-containing protein [Thermoanaerobaculia bacterium]
MKTLFAALLLSCNGFLFQAPVRYSVSADEVVLPADFDGDGLPEIVTSGNHVDQSGEFSLLRNLGDGTFADERLITTGFGETLEQIADLDRDGVPDVVASSYWQNGIATYRGTPLQFGSRMALDTATHGGPTRAVDYDGDGVTDLVSLSFGSGNPVRLHLFHGRADGTFDPKTTFDTTLAIAATPSLRMRENQLEILASERSGHLGLLRWSPGGLSVSRLEAGPGFDLNSMFVDVNEDGIADVVDTNDGGSEASGNPFEWIFVTLARPDGSFFPRRQLAQPRTMRLPTELRAADLDGDGHVDLLASDFRATTIHWFRGQGTGAFERGVGVDAGGPVNDLAIGDVNHDGRPDVVTANNDHSVSVIMNRGRCSIDRRRAARH